MRTAPHRPKEQGTKAHLNIILPTHHRRSLYGCLARGTDTANSQSDPLSQSIKYSYTRCYQSLIYPAFHFPNPEVSLAVLVFF
jgi:hypothetical protein